MSNNQYYWRFGNFILQTGTPMYCEKSKWCLFEQRAFLFIGILSLEAPVCSYLYLSLPSSLSLLSSSTRAFLCSSISISLEAPVSRLLVILPLLEQSCSRPLPRAPHNLLTPQKHTLLPLWHSAASLISPNRQKYSLKKFQQTLLPCAACYAVETSPCCVPYFYLQWNCF